MAARPVYKSFVVERHVDAPRADVWQALLDFLGDATHGYAVPGYPPPHGAGAEKHFRIAQWDLIERTLSFEPPWRRVYEVVAGAPVKRYQGTIALRDDGPACHLIWSYLAEALDDGASDEFLERAKVALTTAADLVVARVASPHE
jgi:hypothetical protein